MKVIEIQTRIAALRGELKLWEGVLSDRSCQHCVHFGAAVCNHPDAGGVAPPPEVQKTGCPCWEYDEIPF